MNRVNRQMSPSNGTYVADRGVNGGNLAPPGLGVAGYAALVALEASRLRRAWHAGVIDADAAMRRLDAVLREIYSAFEPHEAGWTVPGVG